MGVGRAPVVRQLREQAGALVGPNATDHFDAVILGLTISDQIPPRSAAFVLAVPGPITSVAMRASTAAPAHTRAPR